MFVFMGAIGGVLCYAPNLVGHSDNCMPANPISIPIVLEYLIGAIHIAGLCKVEVNNLYLQR